MSKKLGYTLRHRVNLYEYFFITPAYIITIAVNAITTFTVITVMNIGLVFYYGSGYLKQVVETRKGGGSLIFFKTKINFS